MRNPFARRRAVLTYDAHRSHPFQEARDSGLAAYSSGGRAGGRDGGNVSQVVMTSAYVRTANCGVPGCGRPAADEIHAPEE